MNTIRSLLSKIKKIEANQSEKLTMYCFAECNETDKQLQQRVDVMRSESPEHEVVGARWQS